MTNKTMSVLSLSILALLVLTSFASAAVTNIVGWPTLPLSQSSGSFIVNVTEDATAETPVAFSYLNTPLADANGKLITFSITTPSPANLSASTTTPVTISYTVPSGFVFESGKAYSTALTIGTYTPKTLNFAATNEPKEISSCKVTRGANTENNLVVDIDDVSVVNGFGEDAEWFPLDEINVKVNVENTGSEQIKSIVVGWGLYNTDSKKFIMDNEEKSFSLNDGDDKTLTISFKLEDNIDDLKDGSNYKFYVWAKGKDKAINNSPTCASASEDSIDIIIDSNFVVLDSLEVVGAVSCGSQVQITGKVWNIGEDDENEVYLKVYNTQLGINEKVSIGDIDAADSKDLSFLLNIPENAEEGKIYDLTLTVYDEDGDIFENNNNDQSKSFVSLKIEGSCSVTPLASVSATLESEAKAGQELVVKAIITNTGSKESILGINIAGYADWASLVNIDKTSLILNAGASQDVLIKLKVNKDVSGDKTFNAEVTQGDKVLSQPVKVSIEKSSSFPNITGLFSGSLGDNWYLWGIGALNIILVLVIIVVAIKVVKKK